MQEIQEALGTMRANAQRMAGWIVATVVLVVAIALIAPAQLGVVLYKVALLTLATVLAYLIDRTLFRHLRGIATSTPGDVLSAARLLGRAIVFLAVVIGVTLGI